MEHFKVVKSRTERRCYGAGARHPGRHERGGLVIPAGAQHAVALRMVTYGGALYSQGSRLCLECAAIVDSRANRGW